MPIRGSTAVRFAFSTDGLSSDLHPPDHEGVFPPSALAVVDNLNDLSLSFEFGEDFRSDEAAWVDGADLLAIKHGNGMPTFTVLDAGLREIDSWEIRHAGVGTAFACADTDGDLIVGGRRHRVARRDGRSLVEPLATPDGARDCQLESSDVLGSMSLGCIGRSNRFWFQSLNWFRSLKR